MLQSHVPVLNVQYAVHPVMLFCLSWLYRVIIEVNLAFTITLNKSPTSHQQALFCLQN